LGQEKPVLLLRASFFKTHRFFSPLFLMRFASKGSLLCKKKGLCHLGDKALILTRLFLFGGYIDAEVQTRMAVFVGIFSFLWWRGEASVRDRWGLQRGSQMREGSLFLHGGSEFVRGSLCVVVTR
jgi:hypothetical protein